MFYWEKLPDWEGDFVVYAPLTNWPSQCDWIVPGTYRE
jgi:hypothetical protein